MIGKTISHYKILDKIGEGGMGVVYKAEDTKLKRTVALKFLPPEFSRNAEAKERFIHEAQAASALDHPNICTIYEINSTDENQMFIAMAYYEGETLKEKIERKPIDIDESINIGKQIAQGLEKAHDKGIIHRDIKPANIFITNDGLVKILDFGLAKLSGHTKLTKIGSTMGTISYMSPEQAQGLGVDHRTDIWSLGVVLYEMVAGQLPFKGEFEQAVIYSIMNEDPEQIIAIQKDISSHFETIIKKCLEKKASERYQNINQLTSDLHSLKGGLIPETFTIKKVISRTVRKKSLKYVVSACILLLMAIILFGRYFFVGTEAVSSERIPMAVVDFLNETKEEALNGLSGMFITALEQSPRLTMLTRSRMFDILKQMGKDDIDRIDETLGREICREVSVNTMALATVRKFGRNYAIDLKVLDTENDEYILTAREEGTGHESLLSMIDKLSLKVRQKFNEQPKEIQTLNRRIADVTTSNLNAYQHYFIGEDLVNRLKFKEAKQEFGKAIAIDSTFGLAYYRLAYVESWMSGNEGIQMDQLKRSLEFIDRIPDKEQFLVRAEQARLKRGYEAGLLILTDMEQLYPNDKEMLFNMGDWYFRAGKPARAVEYLERILTNDPGHQRALYLFDYSFWRKQADPKTRDIRFGSHLPIQLPAIRERQLIRSCGEQNDSLLISLIRNHRLMIKPFVDKLITESINFQITGKDQNAHQRLEMATKVANRFEDIHGEKSLVWAVNYASSLSLDKMKMKVKADSLYIVGTQLRGKKESRDQAFDIYLKALDIYRKVEDKRGEGSVLGGLGVLHWYKNEPDTALNYFNNGLNIRQEVDDRRLLGNSYNDVGSVYLRFFREYPNAVHFYSQAIKIRTEIGDDEKLGNSFNVVAFAYSKLHQMEKALSYYQKSIELNSKLGDESRMATALLNRGIILRELDDSERALSHYEQALELRRKLGDKKKIANVLNSIGILHKSTGEYEAALKVYKESYKLMEDEKDEKGMSQVLNNIAVVLQHLGKFQDASENLEKALHISQKIEDQKGMKDALSNLGNIYIDLKNEAQAEEYILKALQISRELKEKTGETINLINLGNVQNMKGEYDKAFSSYEFALNIAQEVNRPYLIWPAYFGLGGCYTLQKKYEQALSMYQKVIEFNPDVLRNAQLFKFLLLNRMGKYDKARRELPEHSSPLVEEEWPAPVLRFYMAEITEQELLEETKHENPRKENEQKCEAFYYLGMAHLLNIKIKSSIIDSAKAKNYFKKCIETDVRQFWEYHFSKVELGRATK